MSLQTQIDAAAYGSVVTVAAGTYTEAVTITKPLTLRADGRVEIAGRQAMPASGSRRTT